MPKKKRRSRKSGPKSVHQMPSRAARLADAFRTWRTERGLDPEDAWILEPLIELKRDYLGVEDPTVWPDAETYELLTSVMPRKVHVATEDRGRIAPALGDFFDFLNETGRWSPRSIPFEDVPDLMGELTGDVPEALGDPARRGMAGNIVDLALSEGVDLSDKGAMAEFIERFNAMDDDARRQITDTGQSGGTGGLPGPASGQPGATFGMTPAAGGERPGVGSGAAFGLPSTGAPAELNPYDDEGAEVPLADLWPDFLGEPFDENELEEVVSGADDAEYFANSVLMERADHVMALIGDGVKVTSTDALRQAETRELLTRFGIDGAVRSMWDVPEIALTWYGLSNMGFIAVRGGMAYPAAEPMAWAGPQDDGEARLMAARMLHAGVLAMLVGQGDEEDREDEDEVSALIAAFTHIALMKAATPGSITLTEQIPAGGGPEALLQEQLSIAILDQFEALVTAGLMTRDGDTYHFPPALLELLPAAISAAMDAEEGFLED